MYSCLHGRDWLESTAHDAMVNGLRNSSGSRSLWLVVFVLKHVRTFQCLHYWWVPDSTFIQMLPEQLVFARHSANEWLAGDKKTGGQGSYVSKMVSQNLQSKASRVS